MMDIQKEREALVAEIEQFKAEALKTHIVQCWAETYKIDPFGYHVDDENQVFWMKAQARQMWDFWQAAQAPEGFVLVPKEPTEEMVQAGVLSVFEQHGVRSIYKAMIEAAEGE